MRAFWMCLPLALLLCPWRCAAQKQAVHPHFPRVLSVSTRVFAPFSGYVELETAPDQQWHIGFAADYLASAYYKGFEQFDAGRWQPAYCLHIERRIYVPDRHPFEHEFWFVGCYTRLTYMNVKETIQIYDAAQMRSLSQTVPLTTRRIALGIDFGFPQLNDRMPYSCTFFGAGLSYGQGTWKSTQGLTISVNCGYTLGYSFKTPETSN